MDILLKYAPYKKEKSSGKENFFDTLLEVQNYFLDLKNDNKNYIFYTRERDNKDGTFTPLKRFDVKGRDENFIKDSENIYFFYKQEIIAKAIYVKSIDPEREDKFKNGYKVRNVLLLGKPYPLEELSINLHSRQAIYFIKKEDKKLKKELKELFE